MDFVTALASMITEGLKVYEDYESDPKRRLKKRLEFKEKAKAQVTEIVSKETDVEKADKLAVALLSFIDTL